MASSWYEAKVSCADPECIWRGSAAGYDEDEVLASAGRLLQDHQLAERHQRHYQHCNCLGDKAICCDPTCPCRGSEKRATDTLRLTGLVPPTDDGADGQDLHQL